MTTPTTQATSGKVYAAISKVMSSVEAVAKSRKNPQQGYAYRGIDDMYNACSRLMSENGLMTIPNVTAKERETVESKNGSILHYVILTIQYTICADDGSSIVATVVGEAMDSGDKATNKAMSAAHKYLLLQLFMIPTEDSGKESEEQTHERKAATARSSAPAPAKPAATAPAKQDLPLTPTEEIPRKAKEAKGKDFGVSTVEGIRVSLKTTVTQDGFVNLAKGVKAAYAEGRITEEQFKTVRAEVDAKYTTLKKEGKLA